MKLEVEAALHCAKVLEDYFVNFDRIDDYMRNQKDIQISELPSSLPGMGIEEDLFSDFSMHPNDMDIDVIGIDSTRWDDYIRIISSHVTPPSIPGRNAKYAVIEKNTNKILGFIRLGSPVINCKPRNDLLGQAFTKTPIFAKAFNHTTLMGFTIVPSQPFGFNYLGGKLCAAICCSHKIREDMNKKYGMNLCMFETTSLYGSSKTVSQYDGMKPYIRFKGLTDSNFVPMLDGESYKKLKDYIESQTGEPLVDPSDSSKKLKATTKTIAMVKVALKGMPELSRFNEVIEKAKGLTEQKRYYISHYGFKNFTDVVTGKTDVLVKDDTYDKFELENVVKWWKTKASNRYESLKADGRLRSELEVWTSGKEIQIIR